MILKEGMNVRVVLLPPEHDPDSFARAHTADQVREYIRENEEDFLTFKAKLMLADAGKDPIKRSAVISDMVQSIVQIPDSIQRSVYIKDCARIMDVDENVLVSEVARKRVQQAGGGREAADFMRRQQSQIQQERKVEVEITKPTVAGSSVEALEYELVIYLLKSGHLNYEIMEGKNVVGVNIADEIFYNLDEDKISFLNPVYQKILDTYREQWKQLGVGVKVPERHFINHIDPEVCNMSVDILTSDDNLVPSKLWQQKDVHVESEVEMLSNGVPKAIMLYRSKIIERLIKELTQRLDDSDLSDDDQIDIVKRLNELNNAKTAISHKSQRLIL